MENMKRKAVGRNGIRPFFPGKAAAAVLTAVILLSAAAPSTVMAGAHKWVPASEEYGPGVRMSGRNRGEDVPEQTVEVTREGQEINSLDGVYAICRPGGREDDDPYYSCVALINYYYNAVYNMSVQNMFLGETPLTDELQAFHVTDSPQVGDIGYQTNDEGGPHWFILKRVNEDGSYTVLEQNWKWVEDGRTYATINRRVSYDTTPNLKFFRRPGA